MGGRGGGGGKLGIVLRFKSSLDRFLSNFATLLVYRFLFLSGLG